MLLTITYTRPPATDLGYLLHKNPARVQSFALSFGQAHVFYPEASEERCTAALLLDVDPVSLVRRRGSRPTPPSMGGPGGQQYVNDRPYVASSFLSVALGEVFGTAMGGRSRERPELAETPLPLRARLAVLPAARGGEALLRRLFEPLGYTVEAQGHPLDERFPDWGPSRYYTVTLDGTCRLRDLLTHLSVLVPVLDDEKHYWVDDSEVEKLLRRGGDWLAAHPERTLIVDRYLLHQRRLARAALARLLEADQTDPDADEAAHGEEEETVVERPIRLSDQRVGAVLAALKRCGAKSVLDLGCGEGRLLRELATDVQFTRIVGVDVSHRTLEVARDRLQRLAHRQRERVTLLHGALTYRDGRLAGFDAATVIEVIEHLDPPRLAAFERVLFEYARPGAVVVTTPNVEYNVRFPRLPAGRLRHRDHRFEWTRAEFQAWAQAVAARHGYAVRFLPVGPEDPEVGAPTQMGVFSHAAHDS
jgi:3' terminal RNA ribose 2'-O-methyltransferase Hen1